MHLVGFDRYGNSLETADLLKDVTELVDHASGLASTKVEQGVAALVHVALDANSILVICVSGDIRFRIDVESLFKESLVDLLPVSLVGEDGVSLKDKDAAVFSVELDGVAVIPIRMIVAREHLLAGDSSLQQVVDEIN